MYQSFFLYAPKIIFDLLFDALYFLPWWYGRGLLRVSARAWFFVRDKERELAIVVWIKNVFKPLYDDYNWQNRLKSVILRIGQIILRAIILLFWTATVLILMLGYAVLPVLAVWEIIY